MNARTRRTLAALSTLLGLSCSRSPEAPAPLEPPPAQAPRPPAVATAPGREGASPAGGPGVAQKADDCGEGCGGSFSPAAFEEHVRALKPRLDQLGGGFTVIVEPPFVVIGDGDPDAVRASSERTVRWATAKLKKDFFTKDPSRILDVWLFKDAASYRRNAALLFGEEPSTPYGYYTSTHGALVMNIATGGGTLVHEIVHPFVESNIPDCPPWINEGLGSLFEQSGEEDGHIRGYTNWRLRGLKAAIRQGIVPPFAELTAMDDEAFYRRDRGTNYAQSRYLLYYLQEKGLLLPFYREFLQGRAADPTGYAALRRVLGEEDMAAFKRRWEKFVLGLSFP